MTRWQRYYRNRIREEKKSLIRRVASHIDYKKFIKPKIMTKKEWSLLRIGIRVTCHSWNIATNQNDVNIGTITRINANGSQVYVQWDGKDFGNWYGRLGIELFKK